MKSDGLEMMLAQQITTGGNRILVCPICPDLLDYSAIGEADNMRGRVVRTFFWIMRIWSI